MSTGSRQKNTRGNSKVESNDIYGMALKCLESGCKERKKKKNTLHYRVNRRLETECTARKRKILPYKIHSNNFPTIFTQMQISVPWAKPQCWNVMTY